jgi:hypothetical protein
MLCHRMTLGHAEAISNIPVSNMTKLQSHWHCEQEEDRDENRAKVHQDCDRTKSLIHTERLISAQAG